MQLEKSTIAVPTGPRTATTGTGSAGRPPGGDRVGAVHLRPGSATTRRTAILGAVVGVVGVAGCEVDGPGRRPSRAGRTPPATDPDTVLLEAATRELEELEALVAAATRRAPGAAADLAGLAVLHRAHRAVLPAGETQRRRVRLVGSPQSVVRQVVARERTAGERLADWAVAAQSGALARLLASMSAAIAQRLAVLDPERVTR